MDVAFAMNEKEMYDPYKGILSVKSCNIKNFSLAFYAGLNSILSVELSYINDCRQAGIVCINPRLLKVSGTVIENIDGNGIDISFYNTIQNFGNSVAVM
jgi:hypothetical protein